ncbi:hypothetical protein CR51_30820 [Caballeronia megalochromosomata]|nr:hypothetical protein CR51_30820 [Caballeronia megalochromosomata]
MLRCTTLGTIIRSGAADRLRKRVMRRIPRNSTGDVHPGFCCGGRRRQQERNMKHPSVMDPWSRTLAMLDSRPSRPSEVNESLALMTRSLVRNMPVKSPCFGTPEGHRVNIRVLERLSESTLALSWHDPTSFNYSEQVWALCTARKRGTCALSGQAIRRGQPVYRPRRVGSSVPLNSGAMILALALTPAEQESSLVSE